MIGFGVILILIGGIITGIVGIDLIGDGIIMDGIIGVGMDTIMVTIGVGDNKWIIMHGVIDTEEILYM